MRALTVVLLCSGLLAAQGTQKWTGLLVAAGCDATTAGHESSTTYEESVNQADRNAVSSSAASAMPRGTPTDSCRVDAATTSYALRLADGRTVRFDDAGNRKIHQRLQSTGVAARDTKSMHVVLKGAMRGDTLSVDSFASPFKSQP